MNKGLYTEPIAITRIEDKYGQILAEFIPQQQEAISEDTANKMMYMLMGSTEEQGGTLNRLSDEIKTDNQIAGKTGTTSNKSDGWCVGMINNLCTCVWVGGEERAIHFPKTTNYGYGANTARPIFEDFVLRLYNDSKLPYTKGPIE
jgi:penicillin-binding protein 1A